MNNGEPLSFASHFGVPVELGMVQSVVLESDSCVYTGTFSKDFFSQGAVK